MQQQPSGNGNDGIMTPSEPADAAKGAGGSSSQEGDKVSGTMAQDKTVGASPGAIVLPGSAEVKPEGPKKALEAIRQVIRRAEEILSLPEETNKSEYGEA